MSGEGPPRTGNLTRRRDLSKGALRSDPAILPASRSIVNRFVLRAALRYSGRMAARTALPDGYAEIRRVSFDSGLLIFWLNVAALAPLALAFGAMLALGAGYEAAGAPLALRFLDRRLLPDGYDLPAMIALLLLVLPLHEWCHGLAFRLLGVKRARYGINLGKMLLYATPAHEAYFPRNEFLAVTLAPLVWVSLAGAAGLLLLPASVRLLLALAVAFNAAGAIGDLMATAVVLRYPPGVLVRDFGEAFSIYGPVAARSDAR